MSEEIMYYVELRFPGVNSADDVREIIARTKEQMDAHCLGTFELTVEKMDKHGEFFEIDDFDSHEDRKTSKSNIT